MSITFQFDRRKHLLEVTVLVPTSIDDYQEAVPKIIEAISDQNDLRLLIVACEHPSADNQPDHDLSFFALNEVKKNISRLAISCSDRWSQRATDLTKLYSDGGRLAKVFASRAEAYEWVSEHEH